MDSGSAPFHLVGLVAMGSVFRAPISLFTSGDSRVPVFGTWPELDLLWWKRKVLWI